MQTTEAPRQEKSWRILREGEISPFKIVTVIFIRESYIHIELRRGSPEERCATVKLIHFLISSNEMTFAEFRAHLEDPKHSVRPEILKRFNKVLQNLEEVNASFLYELVHSVIDVEATQTNILRKRITKNSPFGKFLRIVLLNLRKMSYPQALYLYQQLCAYLHPLVDFKKPCWLPKGSSSSSSSAAAAAAAAASNASTETPKIKIESPVVVIKREIDDNIQLQENIPVAQSVPLASPSTSIASAATTPASTERQHEFVLKPLTLSQVPASATSGTSGAKGLKADRRRKKGLDIFLNMVQNRRKNNLMGLSMDVNLSYEYERKKAHGLLSPEQEESYCAKLKERKEKVDRALESIKSLRLSWNPPQPNPNELFLKMHNSSELNSFEVSPESSFQFQPKRQKQRTTPKKAGRPPSARKPKSSVGTMNEGILSDADSDYFLSEDESVGDKIEKGNKKEKEVLVTPTKRGTRSSSSTVSSPSIKFSRSTEKDQLKRKISSEILMQPENAEAEKQDGKLKGEKVSTVSSDFVLGSKRWSDVKFWSRKQIEQTIKLLAADLYHAGSKKYEPAHISAFVEAIKHSPSAQVLLPQLYYLEYLNCLRLKDITRCTESLRTSFDLRIKPNTSELNKGTPYAAYNFAVFYRLMGFKKDSMLYLEEAFQAGHSAADGTCLHYCHNLWSNFYSKPYTEAIVTTTKEIDRHMAYLHSINVIANAYDHHVQGSTPEDIIYQTLWHYGAACEIEEIESILLVSLGSFFSVFGWHDIIAFACQGILYSRLRWPSRAYCAALCLLAQTVLMEGGVELATEIMKYGETLFGLDSSTAGELFGRQNGVFSALSSLLANELVEDRVISCIAAYDKTEALFWRAYNKLINNDWEESEKLLRRLSDTLLENQSYEYCQKNELKLRCLLLQAELRCLCGKPTGGLQYLFEALNLARSIYSDHYIAFCLAHIASIQVELGLLKTAGRTLYEEMRSISRSSCPLLTAKLNIVSVKSSLRLCGATGTGTPPSPTPSMSKASQKYYGILLDEAEEIYGRWKNNYRLRDVLYLKSKLAEINNSQDSSGGGCSGSSTMMDVDEESFESKIEKLPTKLIWSPATCLM